MKYLVCYIAFLFILSLTVQSQVADSVSVKRNNYLAFSVHNAYLAAHYPELKNVGGLYHGIDVRYFFQTNGEKFWHWAYKYPKVGFGIDLGELQNKGVGKMGSVYMFGTFPVYNFGSIQLDWDVCSGMGLVENIYDEVKNPNNIGVSTHWNAYLDLNFNASFRISERMDGFMTFGVSHFSNGAGKKPNMGLNMFGIRTGVAYRLEAEEAEKIKRDDYPEINKKWGFDVRYGIGSVGITGAAEPFKAENVQLFLVRRVSNRHRVGVGFDLIKDYSLVSKQYLLDGNHSDRIGYFTERLEGGKVSLYQGGVMVSNEFVMRRLSLITQLGVIVCYSYDILPLYERFGFRYRLMDGLFADMSLRAHANKAYDITWGLGYSLNRGKD